MTNVPEIRFKGFTDAWEQRAIGEYGYFYYGKSAPKWSVSEDAPTPCIRYGELYTKFDEKIDKVFSRTNIPPNQLKYSTGREVLVPRVGEEPLDFANCSWISLPDVAIGEMISVYNTAQNPLFVAFYFNAMLKHEFAEKVEGGNVSNLYYDRLVDITVRFPDTKEQGLIATFFDKLNDTIAIHKRKLDGLRELKKAYLQVMFPQAGETVPRVRFDGFSEPWCTKKVSELVTLTVREIPKPTKPYKRISVRSHAKGTFQQVVDDPNKVAMDNLYVVHENDLIVNITFAWEHAVAIATQQDHGLLVSHRFPTYIANKSDVNFLRILVTQEAFRQKLKLISPGGAGRNRVLNKNDFANLELVVPSIEEQFFIGMFFNALDKEIVTQASKTELLAQLKSAYLQKMFV